jgi:hypothetical protein
MHKPKPTDPSPSAGSLEDRLRALPEPAVPSGLEGRLLAKIPATAKAPPRLRRIAAIAFLAAAASLAAVVVHYVTWHGREEQVADLKATHDNGQVKTSDSGNSGQFVTRRTAADFPDSLGPARFAWPLAGSSPPASSCPSHALSFD